MWRPTACSSTAIELELSSTRPSMLRAPTLQVSAPRVRYGRGMARRLGLAVAFAGVALSLAVLAGAERAGGASNEEGVPARGAAVFQAEAMLVVSRPRRRRLDREAGTGSRPLARPARGADARVDRGARGAAHRLRRHRDDSVRARPVPGGARGPRCVRRRAACLDRRRQSHPLRTAPAPPPETTATPATVRGWVGRKGLRGSAARGASVFGREGCLSCHRYLGAGRARFGAPTLSNGAPTVRSVAATVAYLRSPWLAATRRCRAMPISAPAISARSRSSWPPPGVARPDTGSPGRSTLAACSSAGPVGCSAAGSSCSPPGSPSRRPASLPPRT